MVLKHDVSSDDNRLLVHLLDAAMNLGYICTCIPSVMGYSPAHISNAMGFKLTPAPPH